MKRLLLDLCYNVFVLPVLRIAYLGGAIVSPKIRERFLHAASSLEALSSISDTGPRVWFHAASMGEFEQAKPVIEELKQHRPDVIVIVSFYSPSGFRHQRSYPFADAVVYMPFDSRRRIRKFVDKLKPDCAVFIRYDLWWNVLHELRRRHINTLLIDATVTSSRLMKLPVVRNFYKEILSCLTEIFAVNKEQATDFRALVPDVAVSTSSDTRFDRILNEMNKSVNEPVIPSDFFSAGDFIVVLGSTWEEDEKIFSIDYSDLSRVAHKNVRLIVVPHEPNEPTLRRIESIFPGILRLSKLSLSQSSSHILVDSVGSLLRLYRQADAVYVGGGFGAGVHSVAEPAARGIPLSCGPRVERSVDAKNLSSLGGLSIVNSRDEFTHWLTEVASNELLQATRGVINKNYIEAGSGWSRKIAEVILARIF